MVETKQVNKFGRSYSQEVPLDQDLRCLIVDSILKEGGGVEPRVIFLVLLRSYQDGFVCRARQ
jgi:hypothetical protein